jgi:hypothetical protein
MRCIVTCEESRSGCRECNAAAGNTNVVLRPAIVPTARQMSYNWLRSIEI